MRRDIRSRAVVLALAVVAFVLALSVGGATAAGIISGRQIKNHSIGLAKLTKKAQKALRGQRGPQGLQGPAGPAGPPGPAGTAVAFARVSGAGKVVVADTKNIAQANVVRTKEGQYCIRGLPTSIHSAVASPSGGKAIGAVVGPLTATCNFVVSTYAANGNRVDSGFYIQFA
jgi:hypothetical protein